MNHLSDLLDDISSEAPIDHLDLDDVIGAARSRVRRRRVVAGIAAAAVVSLTAAVVIPGDGGSEQAPAEPPQVSVLTLDDAVEADASRDYRVLHQFMAHSTDQAMSGDFVRGVLADGTVVLQRYPNGPNGTTEIVLVEPDEDRAVAAPADVVNYLGATDNEIVFGSDNRGLSVLCIAETPLAAHPGGHGRECQPDRPAAHRERRSRLHRRLGPGGPGSPNDLRRGPRRWPGDRVRAGRRRGGVRRQGRLDRRLRRPGTDCDGAGPARRQRPASTRTPAIASGRASASPDSAWF